MKKAAILGVSAFYLLLTTGMFVCIVHCAAENVFKKGGGQIAADSCSMHHSKKSTNKNNDDCCKHHGNYVVKENIQPDAHSFLFSAVSTAAVNPELPVFKFRNIVVTDTRAVSNAPPWQAGTSRYIQFRALLI